MTQPSQPFSVLCAGRLYCDLVFTDVPRLPTMGTETFAGGLGLHTGGGAFITAVTLAKLGQRLSLLSTFPAAPFNKLTEIEILQNDINIDLCAEAPLGSDPQVTVAIASKNDRAFLSRKSGAALPKIHADKMNGFHHLHIGELRTLKEHPELIDLARDAKLTISLDCGWDDELMNDANGLAKLIASVDIFLPNEMEANQLKRLGIAENTAPLTVIKCGSEGARAHTKNDFFSAETWSVDVIDATGAGDAFNGGFIYEWLRNSPIDQCLRTGNACGTAAVQGRGGTGGLNSLLELVAVNSPNLQASN
ncbi:PfkB family carbohydrate kinase [Lentilitoribacter sp. EG35]